MKLFITSNVEIVKYCHCRSFAYSTECQVASRTADNFLTRLSQNDNLVGKHAVRT